MSYVDLHIHSYYSDGTMSPREIAEAALFAGVGLVAIADHDALEGSRELKACCEHLGIGYIPAVEIDTLNGGGPFHVLGYGIDTEDPEFIAFVRHVRYLLDQLSVRLIEAMQRDYACLSMADFMDFTYQRHLGGWKALHYLVEKGVAPTLKEAVGFYPRYGCTYDIVDFPSVSEACRRIRLAGGRAVLAHPGEMIDHGDIGTFCDGLRQLLDLGLDGVECYYPSHTAAVTRACLEICEERGLITTVGSDCHGAFGGTSVGQMRIPIERVNLNGLI